MAALTNLSDLINRASGGSNGAPETVWFHKTGRIGGGTGPTLVAGRMVSAWQYEGFPGAGATPTVVENPTNTTPGALPITDAISGRQKWLIQAVASSIVNGSIMLYDRLLHIGGLSGTVITAQTVGGTLSRASDGVGNFAFAEIYSTLGATSTTITATYTDSQSTTQTSPAVAIGGTGFNEQSRAIILPTAAGSKGVRSVTSVTLAATTGTAGNFGITIARPIAVIGLQAGGHIGWRDFSTGFPGIPFIPTGCCIGMLIVPGGTTLPELPLGALSFVEA